MDELLRRKGPTDGGVRLDEDMTASDPLLDQSEDAAGPDQGAGGSRSRLSRGYVLASADNAVGRPRRRAGLLLDAGKPEVRVAAAAAVSAVL